MKAPVESFVQPPMFAAPLQSSPAESSRWRLKVWLSCWLVLSGAASVFGAEAVNFERQIQPIFEANCYKCHGPSRSENGLRLDSKADALKGGEHGALLKPGKSGESLLIAAVTGSHSEIPRMPKKREALAGEQIELLKAWVDAGAAWPESASVKPTGRDHWAFQPIRRPATPTLPTSVSGLVRSPIDSFILERLSRDQHAYRPEADRITLLRRVSIDLTGLPPSPEEVDAFLADPPAEAYHNAVERLLASPHYGEKWGRWWLDAARYADSNGFEKDRTRSIWPYRDWVIDAMNRDLPFDQFTIEQLAGDLLPNATLNQRIATGFLRNSMVNMEGGILPEKFRVESIIDRVDCVGRTWLGLTISCAQCHSHKYDPISQTEYYQFYGFLNQDEEPVLDVPSGEQKAKRTEILAKVAEFEGKLISETQGLAARQREWEKECLANTNTAWEVLDASEWHSQPMKFEKLEDRSLLGGGDIWNNGVLRIWVDVPYTNISHFRLEALNSHNLPFGGPGLEGNGQFQVCEFTVEATPLKELADPNAGATNFIATTNLIHFVNAVGDLEKTNWPAKAMIDGEREKGGWASDYGYGLRNQERRAIFEAEKPFGFEGGTRLLITLWSKPKESPLSNHILGRVRLSLSTNAGPVTVDPLSSAQRRIAAMPESERTPAEKQELFRAFLFHNPALAESAQQWDALWSDWPRAENTTLAMARREMARPTRIFKRGDWQKPTVVVNPDVPSVLHSFPPDAPRNRLGLARWLVDTRNPLTARVIVNRIWQVYFGQGLLLTPEDFGTRAEKPVYPELLDWLAAELMDPKAAEPGNRGIGTVPWSLKHLHRLIVHSAVYRQSSTVTPELLEADPYNRTLARGPRFRVDAEGVQDIALKASGLLSEKVGGPSVFPPLPDGVMSLAYGQIAWNVSEGEDRYRRAMYTFWKRSVPYPAMLLFDTPSAEQSCVRRTRSNTPLQALVTLNEPTFNQAARWLAWRALFGGGKSDSDRAVWVFRQCLSRRPTENETQLLLKLLSEARAEFGQNSRNAAQFAFADPKNPAPLPPGLSIADLAAWSTVSRAVLNLDETLTKE
jgi:mono/diheme cytochrome c family protein